MYDIRNDIFHGLIEITVSGFWTTDQFVQFKADLADAIHAFPGDKPPMSLYNFTDAAIQSQTVVAEMQKMARAVASDRSVALYTEGSMARMQARRIASEAANMRVFETRSSALEWLAQVRRHSSNMHPGPPVGRASD